MLLGQGMVQSKHSRWRVPISLSQREFAFGLCTGVAMTSRPIRATEASNPVDPSDNEALRVSNGPRSLVSCLSIPCQMA
jgi:hypothetical protein